MMIINYGFSVAGKSHIDRGIICQDAHCIKKLNNGWIIAAVADGVGSAPNSDIGSKIAVKTVVEFCEKYMPYDYNIISIKSMLRTAYNYALKSIIAEAESNNNPIESYDTTLSMVIYDGRRIIYGNSGDGAIIGLNAFGDYVEITKPQKGADGISVIPLRGGYTTWEIDEYDEELVSVMLITDGMLETFYPYLLMDQETKKKKMYVPLGCFFMDPYGFSSDESGLDKDIKEIENLIIADGKYDTDDYYKRLSKIYKQHSPQNADKLIDEIKLRNFPLYLMYNEQDDKTVVVLINKDLSIENKDDSFFSEPDWTALQDLWNRKAYPHLYEPREASDLSNGESEADQVSETLPEAKSNEAQESADNSPESLNAGDTTQQTAFQTNDIVASGSQNDPNNTDPSDQPNNESNQSTNGNGTYESSFDRQKFIKSFFKALISPDK